MTAYAQDVTLIKEKEKIDIAEQLIVASRACGRNPFALAFDFLKLRKKPGKLRMYEYFLYELYDQARWTQAEREAFVSAHIHWPLVNACNNGGWWAITEDKWLSACFLEHNNIPTPQTIAVFDSSERSYGNTPKLNDEANLKAFLTAHDSFPIFAKPIGGMWSAGAVRIAAVTDTHVLLDGHEPQTYEEMVTSTFGNVSYILQNCLRAHSFFDGVTTAIPTVRCLNVVEDGKLSVPYAMLKLPRGANIADNFWRPGNLLCQLAPESGEVLKLVAVKDGRRVELDSLPDSDRQLIGEALPNWQELQNLNSEVASLHAGVRFGSTDIALTADGPVVVEVNNGCAFELMQIATGEGMLDEKMIAYFRKNGAKI